MAARHRVSLPCPVPNKVVTGEPSSFKLQAPDSSRRIQSNISDSLKLSIIQIYTNHSLDYCVLQLIAVNKLITHIGTEVLECSYGEL
jgi:hypothetical protein